jgi:hypothetical protein
VACVDRRSRRPDSAEPPATVDEWIAADVFTDAKERLA